MPHMDHNSSPSSSSNSSQSTSSSPPQSFKDNRNLAHRQVRQQQHHHQKLASHNFFKTAKLPLILDDLVTRFIINVPDHELLTLERIAFQIEAAHWYYEDFVREINPALPNFSLKQFFKVLEVQCPDLLNGQGDKAFKGFMAYKSRVPTCGAIILSESLKDVLVVRGWGNRCTWSFPRGKINAEESPLKCAIREVLEETGFDISSYLVYPADKPVRTHSYEEEDEDGEAEDNEPVSIEHIDTKTEKVQRMYLVVGVPLGTDFKTQTRKEIGGIEWHSLSSLGKESNGVKYYQVYPYLGKLRNWVKRNKRRVWYDDAEGHWKVAEGRGARVPEGMRPLVAKKGAKDRNEKEKATQCATDDAASGRERVKSSESASTDLIVSAVREMLMSDGEENGGRTNATLPATTHAALANHGVKIQDLHVPTVAAAGPRDSHAILTTTSAAETSAAPATTAGMARQLALVAGQGTGTAQQQYTYSVESGGLSYKYTMQQTAVVKPSPAGYHGTNSASNSLPHYAHYLANQSLPPATPSLHAPVQYAHGSAKAPLFASSTVLPNPILGTATNLQHGAAAENRAGSLASTVPEVPQSELTTAMGHTTVPMSFNPPFSSTPIPSRRSAGRPRPARAYPNSPARPIPQSSLQQLTAVAATAHGPNGARAPPQPVSLAPISVGGVSSATAPSNYPAILSSARLPVTASQAQEPAKAGSLPSGVYMTPFEYRTPVPAFAEFRLDTLKMETCIREALSIPATLGRRSG